MHVSCNVYSDWGHILITYKNQESKFSYHLKTGEIFNTDPVYLIRFKCLGLTVSTPVTSIARAIYYLVKSAFIALQNLYYYLEDRNPKEQKDSSFFKTIYESPRALTYGISLTKTAFLGIFNPLEKRREYGVLERELNHHTDGKPHRDKYYIAICAQPLAKLQEYGASNEDLKKVETRLIRYLTDDGAA